jgi:hypothetical protein
MELLQGPLLNPRRLEEALRAKYLRRLIGFLRPSNRRFADISKTPVYLVPAKDILSR